MSEKRALNINENWMKKKTAILPQDFKLSAFIGGREVNGGFRRGFTRNLLGIYSAFKIFGFHRCANIPLFSNGEMLELSRRLSLHSDIKMHKVYSHLETDHKNRWWPAHCLSKPKLYIISQRALIIWSIEKWILSTWSSLSDTFFSCNAFLVCLMHSMHFFFFFYSVLIYSCILWIPLLSLLTCCIVYRFYRGNIEKSVRGKI